MKKKIIIVSSIILIVITIATLYQTFASSTTSEDNIYDIVLTGASEDIVIPAYGSKIILYQITNTNKGVVQYGIGYKSESDVSVKVYQDSVDTVSSYIDYGENKYVKLRLTNNSDSAAVITLKAILGYENGGDLIPLDDFTLVTETLSATFAESSTWYAGSTNKATVTKIIFSNNYEVTGNETEAWPAAGDFDGDGTNDSDIICYLNGTELTIVGDGTGKIYANADSSNMFSNFSALTSIENISMLDTSNVTSMSYMFAYCTALTELDVFGFDTSSVITLDHMFFYCKNIETIDTSDFDTSNVTNMSAMFYNCESLTSLDVSNFDTSKVTTMSYMFGLCYALTNLNLSSFNTSNVYDMGYMFEGDKLLTTIYVSNSWSTSSVTSSTSMFRDCSSLVGGAGTTHSNSYITATYAHIDGGTSNPGYFTQK